MTLKEWIKKTGRKQTWVAERAGVSVSTIHRIATGKTKPSLDLVQKIERITDGAVGLHDWPQARGGNDE